MDYEFLMENYIWIIVIAVIILMTIIGFIADKTHFGEKKEKKVKVKKQVEKVENKDENLDQEPVMDDFMNPDFKEEPELESKEETESLSEDNFDFPVEPENVELGSNEMEDLSLSENQNDEINFETPIEESKGSEENVNYEENNNLSEIEMPLEQNQTESLTQEDSEFNLPSIDKLNQEIADVEEDEDVWKF